MLTDLRQWYYRHARAVLLGTSGLLLLFSLLLLVKAASGDSQATINARADSAISDLRDERDEAQEKAAEQHERLQEQLPGLDAARLQRDQGLGDREARWLVQSASSSLPAGTLGQVLTARHGFLDQDSQVVSTFLPRWLSSTKGTQESGLGVTTVSTTLQRVRGLDYHYVSLVRADPVLASSDSDSQYLLVRYDTDPQGLTSVEASRLVSHGRHLLADPTRASSRRDS